MHFINTHSTNLTLNWLGYGLQTFTLKALHWLNSNNAPIPTDPPQLFFTNAEILPPCLTMNKGHVPGRSKSSKNSTDNLFWMNKPIFSCNIWELLIYERLIADP